MPSMEEFFTLDQATALQDAFSGVYSRISKVESADKSAQQIMLTLPADATDLDSAIEIAIQDYLEPLLAGMKFQVVPSGVLLAFSGTLQDARALQSYQVCDGTGDPITPDLRNMFVMGASADSDAGGVGGFSSYKLKIAIPTHDTHTHPWTYSGCTGEDTGSHCCVSNAHGVVPCTSVPADHHVHCLSIAGTTGNVDPVSALTHNDCDMTVATLPPYYTVIWLQKR